MIFVYSELYVSGLSIFLRRSAPKPPLTVWSTVDEIGDRKLGSVTALPPGKVYSLLGLGCRLFIYKILVPVVLVKREGRNGKENQKIVPQTLMHRGENDYRGKMPGVILQGGGTRTYEKYRANSQGGRKDIIMRKIVKNQGKAKRK